MHRSAIGVICVDLPAPHFDGAAEFWRGALGAESRRGTAHPEYEVLSTRVGHARVLLQRVGDPTSRVHLDVHTDDVAAEVARLRALGAIEVERHDDWVVLADPAGTLLCVVPVEPGDPVLDGAPSWGD
jgi:hypothetical protein